VYEKERQLLGTFSAFCVHRLAHATGLNYRGYKNMTTKQDLLQLIEEIDAEIEENTKALKPPTLAGRIAKLIAHEIKTFKLTKEQKKKQHALWKQELKELPKLRAARAVEAKKLRARKEKILEALSVWIDAGDVIGSYE
tara:strand:- start:715 stop:1131 length:417 start_codon:yes stop_codon:yes gene_type:complete